MLDYYQTNSRAEIKQRRYNRSAKRSHYGQKNPSNTRSLPDQESSCEIVDKEQSIMAQENASGARLQDQKSGRNKAFKQEQSITQHTEREN